MIKSNDEFSKLRKVIIGRIDNACTPPDEPAYRVKSNGASKIHGFSGPCNNSNISKAKKQIDNLVKILEDENVEVLRPEVYDYKKEIKTPNFSSAWQNCSSCPRDIFTVLDNTIIEAPMSWRSRFFEYTSYRTLLNELFIKDRKMNWLAVPKNLMNDEMYNLDYPCKKESVERQELIDKQIFCLKENQICFDAADIYRVGKDLFYHTHYWSNNLGYEWLNRHYNDKYNIHKIYFTDNHIPTHLDAIINIPRPGVLIKNPVMNMNEDILKKFKENNEWEIFDAPPPTTFMLPQKCTSTPWLHINMLSVNEDTIIVEESETEMIKFLEDTIGINVIKVPYRDAYSFGGSVHCMSLDLVRDGKLVSYL